MSRALWLLIALAGCVSRTPPVTLHHGFPVGHRILHPSTDEVVIAVGATAELDFFDPPARLQGGSGWVDTDDVTTIEVLSARSEKPEVVDIVGTDRGGITIQGRQMGWTKILLSTSRGEGELVVHVARPAQVDVDHHAVDLPPEAPRVFLVGGTARFAMIQRDAAGRVLGGWGNMPPVRVDPPGAARTELREGDIEHVDVTIERAGEITLRPLGGDPVTITAVDDPGEVQIGVDALRAPPETAPLTALRTGTPQLVALWVRRADGARVFGIIEHARLVSLTPAACEVERMERWYSEGIYSVTPLAPGECALEASFGETSRVTLSVPVEQ